MIKYVICFVVWMMIWSVVSLAHYLFVGYLPGYKEAAFVLVGWAFGVFVVGFLDKNV